MQFYLFFKFSSEKLAEVREELFEDWAEGEWTEPRQGGGIAFESSSSSDDDTSSVTAGSSKAEESGADGGGTVKVLVMRRELV